MLSDSFWKGLRMLTKSCVLVLYKRYMNGLTFGGPHFLDGLQGGIKSTYSLASSSTNCHGWKLQKEQRCYATQNIFSLSLTGSYESSNVWNRYPLTQVMPAFMETGPRLVQYSTRNSFFLFPSSSDWASALSSFALPSQWCTSHLGNRCIRNTSSISATTPVLLLGD